MNENLKKFIQKASEDSELQEKMMEMNEAMLEDAKQRFIKLAEENGFIFTKADIDDLYVENEEDELKAISGGAYTERHRDGRPFSGCHCHLFGGGSKDQYQKRCGCVAGGCGGLTDYGKERVRAGEIHYVGNSHAPVAMFCVVQGQGDWESPMV